MGLLATDGHHPSLRWPWNATRCRDRDVAGCRALTRWRSQDGFLGTEPFGRACEGLEERDAEPIVWSRDDLAKSLPPGPRPESPRVLWVFTADAGCCVTAT